MGGTTSSSLNSTEMLDVNTMKWAIGPPLPFAAGRNRGVESVSDPYLGFLTGGGQKKMYGLKKTIDNMYTWEEVNGMKTARTGHSIVNAPSSLLPNC